MSLSIVNSSIVPLTSGQTFLPSTYDNILDFAEINISIKCDVGFEMTYIYSQDKINVDHTVVNTVSASVDTHFFRVPVKDRYFKVSILATQTMDVFNMQTIYKSNIIYTPSSGSGADVNITNPYLDVHLTQQTVGLALDSSLTTINNTLSTKGNAVLFATPSCGVNGLSSIVNMSNKNISNVSLYGNVNNATVLTIQFSNDGTTFYDTQYTYNITAASDWGFSMLCSPYYFRLKSSADVAINAIINYL